MSVTFKSVMLTKQIRFKSRHNPDYPDYRGGRIGVSQDVPDGIYGRAPNANNTTLIAVGVLATG